MEKQLMIGGYALRQLGSSRHTPYVDYLIHDSSSKLAFLFDQTTGTNYCNANGNPFFAAVWEYETKNIGPLASPQALLELKAYAFVQHGITDNWIKLNDAEFDIKFLVRTFHLHRVMLLPNFISESELTQVNHLIQSVRR